MSPLPLPESKMEAVLREAKATATALLEAERKKRIEDRTDDRVLSENTKVSWTSGICVACYGIRYPEREPTRVKNGPREQCCDCGMPTSDGIYFRTDPTTVRYPRVVRDG